MTDASSNDRWRDLVDLREDLENDNTVLPMLWKDHVIGWANLKVTNGTLRSEIGYTGSRAPRDRAFKQELEAELDRMRMFLGLER